MCAVYGPLQTRLARNGCVVLSSTPAQRLSPLRITCMVFRSLTSGPDKWQNGTAPLGRGFCSLRESFSRMRPEVCLSPSAFFRYDPTRRTDD